MPTARRIARIVTTPAPGAEIRVYSGSSGNVRAATHNFVPVTLVDISLDANASVARELPSSYNGFVYVIRGSLRAGANDAALGTGQVGWLDRPANGTPSALRLSAGDGPARAILYAGEPTNVPIVMHGPFVAESRADLLRNSRDYMQGRFPRISELHAAVHSD